MGSPIVETGYWLSLNPNIGSVDDSKSFPGCVFTKHVESVEDFRLYERAPLHVPYLGQAEVL
jgi:hypothetical protein